MRGSILIAGATLAFSLQAEPPSIVLITIDLNDRTHMIVDFDNPLPDPATISQPEEWIIYTRTTASTARAFVDRVDVSGLKDPTGEHHVDLFLKAAIADKPLIQDLQILLAATTGLVPVDPKLSASALINDTKSGRTGPLTTANGRDDSDIYFNGSYTAVKGGSPVYDVDAFAGYMWALQSGKSYYGKVGVYGEMRTKMSATADPDSFLTYLVYQNVVGGGGWWAEQHIQSPIFDYRLWGAEFDRSGKELHLINSPVLTIPIRPVRPPNNMSDKIAQWPQVNLNLGTEFVDVLKSALAPTGRWHTRGLLGATFAFGYQPKTKYLYSWQVTSSWQVRLPSAPEIFYDDKFAPINPTTKMKDPTMTPPMLGTQPRHNFDTKFTYNYAEWGGFTFEHTYGSLPPAFIKTDQTFALGLTFNLQQSNFGRYSILRP